MWLHGLDDALRAGRIGHWISPGWEWRGHGDMSGVRAIMVHHTAGGGPNDWRIVQDGRAGLAGPLSHMTLERDGGVRLLAAGQCWHAGTGSHPRVGTNNGNTWCIGIEGVSDGVGADAWTAAQRREYPRLCAALCRHYGLPADAVIGHKEWTNRKIDPGEWGMNDFRAEVRRHLGGTTEGDDDLRADERKWLLDVHRALFQDGYHKSNVPGSTAEMRGTVMLRNTDAAAFRAMVASEELRGLFREYFEKAYEVRLPGRVEENTNTGFVRSTREAVGRLSEDTKRLDAVEEKLDQILARLDGAA